MPLELDELAKAREYKRSVLFDELRAKLLYRVQSTFAQFSGSTSYTEHLSPTQLAGDLLDALQKEIFIFHYGGRDTLKVVYKGEVFEFEDFLKELAHFSLGVLDVIVNAESRFLNEVLYIVKTKTYLLRDKVQFLKRYLVTKNFYLFDRKTGEFVPCTANSVIFFLRLFGDKLRIERITKFINNLERAVEAGQLSGDDDISQKMIDGLTGREFMAHLISSLPFPTRLDVDYIPDANAPRFMQFLKEVIDEKYHTSLKRFAGYILFEDLPYSPIAVLVGEGANGKSTFLNVLIDIFGVQNVATVSVQQLASRFTPATLENKLVNIYPDLSAQALRNTGLLKAITGGDYIPMERKFKDPYVGKVSVKHIFSANLLPPTDDKTYAFYRRWLIFQFPNQFAGENADPHLSEKLRAEKSGIFNWILEGFRELKKEGTFAYPHTIDEIIDIYEVSSDTLKQFIENYAHEGTADDVITKDEFYALYQAYCKEHNLSPRSKTYVSRHLKEYVHTVEADIKKIGGEVKRIWRGIIVDYYPPSEQSQESENESEEDDTVVVRALEEFRVALPERDVECRKEDVLTLPAKVAKILQKAGKVEIMNIRR